MTTVQDFIAEQAPCWFSDDYRDQESIEAISHGGCASGAYMPAVTYGLAAKTMAKHGDEVLEYICEELGELPKPSDEISWSGLACYYLSYAVELWAHSMVEQFDDYEEYD